MTMSFQTGCKVGVSTTLPYGETSSDRFEAEIQFWQLWIFFFKKKVCYFFLNAFFWLHSLVQAFNSLNASSLKIL